MTILVVTRDKRLWGKEELKVFLGSYCLEHEDFNLKKIEIVESPWRSYYALLRASAMANEYYEKLLYCMASALNKVHLTTHSVKFWKIFIGPYLRFFTHVVYDRYYRLLQAIKKYQDLKLNHYQESYDYTVNDTENFLSLVKYDDGYNLHIIKEIIYKAQMDIKVLPCINLEDNHSLELIKNAKYTNKNLKGKATYLNNILKYIVRNLNEFCLSRADTLLYHTGMTSKFLFVLTLLFKGKLASLPSMHEEQICFDSKKLLRQKLKEIIQKETNPHQDLFYRILLDMVISELPTCFLEGYQHLEKMANKNTHKLHPKVICSATAWYYDEVFKLWCGQMAENGVKLVGLQHGGNYGVYEHGVIGVHEFSILDSFFTWGWSCEQIRNYKKVVGLKFLNSNLKSHKTKSKDILFCANNIINYNFTFFVGDADSKLEYLFWQRDFLSSLSDKITPFVRYRSYFYNGSEIKSYLREELSQVTIEDRFDRSFEDSLSDCMIYVSDYLSTSFLESLFFNKPAVIFLNPKKNIFTKKFRYLFDMMYELKIIHNSPKDAAMWITNVYHAIDDWWQQEECQEGIRDFCKYFACDTKYPVWQWYNALKSV